jgi:hypothetical protein
VPDVQDFGIGDRPAAATILTAGHRRDTKPGADLAEQIAAYNLRAAARGLLDRVDWQQLANREEGHA